jgi:hypothetical protein
VERQDGAATKHHRYNILKTVPIIIIINPTLSFGETEFFTQYYSENPPLLKIKSVVIYRSLFLSREKDLKPCRIVWYGIGSIRI